MVIYEALCFDVAQGRMNGVPNETRTQNETSNERKQKEGNNNIRKIDQKKYRKKE